MLIYSLVATHQCRAVRGVPFPRAAKQNASPWYPSPFLPAAGALLVLAFPGGVAHTETWEKCLKNWNFSLSTDTCITPLVSKKLDAALSNSPLGNHLSKIKNLVCLPPNCATTLQDVLVFFFRSQSSPTASILNLILCFLNLSCLLVLCSDVPVWEITWETS